jgi:hypothetical protein
VGWCDWKDFGTTADKWLGLEIYEATIYMQTPDHYPTRECWSAILAHEERHAEEGDWHGSAVHYEEACIGYVIDDNVTYEWR